MYFKGKKWHFKIKCNCLPLFFLCHPKIFKFQFFNFKINQSPACPNIFFCLESKDTEVILVWPSLRIGTVCVANLYLITGYEDNQKFTVLSNYFFFLGLYLLALVISNYVILWFRSGILAIYHVYSYNKAARTFYKLIDCLSCKQLRSSLN